MREGVSRVCQSVHPLNGEADERVLVTNDAVGGHCEGGGTMPQVTDQAARRPCSDCRALFPEHQLVKWPGGHDEYCELCLDFALL